jgi:AcrR family transcriptional regulator
MEGVAARAGVAKTTVYRGWPDRAALAADAFLEGTRDLLAFPSTGSAREDFRGQIHAVAALLRGPVGAAIAGMAAGAREDPAVGRALGERWLGPRQRWGAERLRRAQAAGESPPDLDVPGALAALYGPLYAALLLGLGPPTRAQVDGYLGVVFAAVFPGGGGGGGGGR